MRDREKHLIGEPRARLYGIIYDRLEELVLRRSLESTQCLSIRYTERLTEAGIEQLVGTVGDSYDNGLAESIIGLYKTEVIRPRGPLARLGGGGVLQIRNPPVQGVEHALGKPRTEGPFTCYIVEEWQTCL